jgi:thiol-disulfide isomerase/thioredoxin
MKKIVLLIALITQCLTAQTIQGTFPQARKNEIVVKSYNGFDEKELTKTTTDSLGNFTIMYPKNYIGATLLQIKNAGSVIVLLNQENFEMQWQNLQDFNTLKFINSPENDAFAQGIKVNQEVEQKLAGLKYLLPLYKENKTNENWLQNEIKNQELVFDNFINSLPKESYVKKYLSYRKFLGDLQLTQERYKELNRVKQHEISFKKLDFASDDFWHSGLLKELLSSYYQVFELYQDKELITKSSIEANEVWLKALENQPTKQQEIAEFCFTLLEKKGLTSASEQIALAMLNKDNCQLTDKQTDLFEQYRKLAIGKIAPNIVFENVAYMTKSKDLHNLPNKYKLVVFGASWCPNCQTDYPSLVGKYKKLKEKHDLEVIYISIDTDKKVFEEYYKETPFITFCDTKGWETQAAKDYHVFATPTYILLDKELKILSKIQSPEHLEAWLQANGKK